MAWSHFAADRWRQQEVLRCQTIIGMGDLRGASAIIRFGAFELDLVNAELRKSGVRIRLHDQPYRILSVLLQNPGQLVTREELQKAVWTDETIVDFEHGLNSAIAKLRETLGDSASHPRYLETVPRRGYRFIAPVEVIERQRDTERVEAADSRARTAARSGTAGRAWRYGVIAAVVTGAVLVIVAEYALKTRPVGASVKVSALTSYPGTRCFRR